VFVVPSAALSFPWFFRIFLLRIFLDVAWSEGYEKYFAYSESLSGSMSSIHSSSAAIVLVLSIPAYSNCFLPGPAEIFLLFYWKFPLFELLIDCDSWDSILLLICYACDIACISLQFVSFSSYDNPFKFGWIAISATISSKSLWKCSFTKYFPKTSSDSVKPPYLFRNNADFFIMCCSMLYLVIA